VSSSDISSHLSSHPSSPPSRSERSRLTAALLLEARETPDPSRREQLLDEVVLLNRCVAEAIAQRYRGRGIPVEDLQQSALEGLVKAVRKFDPSIRPDLLSYAVPTIRGEVQRWFRDQGWMVRPPRRLQELQWRVTRGVEHLAHELGREPTSEELSSHLGCATREIDETLQSFGSFRPASLDGARPEGGGLPLAEVLPDEHSRDEDAAEARMVLAPAVRTLSPRDRLVLYLRFFEGRSQQEIADRLGVTQMQVSRLLRRILRDLTTELEPPVTPSPAPRRLRAVGASGASTTRRPAGRDRVRPVG
jgi:RNA polymerase sigma-B factor